MTSLSTQVSGALAYAIEKIEREAWLDLFVAARDVHEPTANEGMLASHQLDTGARPAVAPA